MAKRNKTLVVLTNIPTPYRVTFYNTLYKVLDQQSIMLHVLFCAETEPNRHWEISKDEFRFPFTIMKGVVLPLKSFYPHLNLGVVSTIRKLKPNWLLVAGAWNTPTMLLASRKLWYAKGTKTIFWSEGHEDAVRFKKGLIPKLRAIVLKGYDAFAVPNDKTKKFLEVNTMAKKNSFIFLPNTVDNSFYKTDHLSKLEHKERLGVDRFARIIVQISQVEDRKGVKELIEGYKKLGKEHRDKSLLVIVGEGSLKEELQTDVQGLNILITGHCSKEEVRNWLLAADAFILASKLDSNPLTPIEASFMRLPILLSCKAGNAAEIVTEGENGYLIEEITPQHICELLRRIIEFPEKALVEMGKYSLGIVNNNFDQIGVAKSFVKQLEALSKKS